MQKLIPLILLIIFGINICYANNNGNDNGCKIVLVRAKTTHKRPQAPAQIPVVCSHDEYSVFVESRYSLFADITVEDESGTIIASTAALLTPELPLSLSINEAGTFEITIQIEDTTYSGTFTL